MCGANRGQVRPAQGTSRLPNGAGSWISDQDVAQARRDSPEELLRSRFGLVLRERSGRTLVVPGVLRADLRGDRWVACHWNGAGIGDNVALARFLFGCGFVDAVARLVGQGATADNGDRPQAGVWSDTEYRLRVPSQSDPRDGRVYLSERGITDAVVREAEVLGSVLHFSNGVAFAGRDREAAIRAITVRYFRPLSMPDGSSVTKRDLRGSNKSYPSIFNGDPNRVVVVEGAISGLAAQSLSEIKGRGLPTVIATGGVNLLRWILEPDTLASDLVARARDVTILAENETDHDGVPDPIKQQLTDGARRKLAHALGSVRSGVLPRLIYPPAGIKDVAEWLMATKASVGRNTL
jgi:hypothetical protein